MAGRIVELSEAGIPGVIVVRRPNDAVLSWSIYNNWALDRALEDYLDFHKFLLPRVTSLNVACFDWFTKHPQQFMSAATALRGSHIEDFEFSDEFLERVNTTIENMWRNGEGVVNEQRVARPSEARMEKKNILLKEIQSSRYLQRTLAEATEIYGEFLARSQDFSVKARAIGDVPPPAAGWPLAHLAS